MHVQERLLIAVMGLASAEAVFELTRKCVINLPSYLPWELVPVSKGWLL